jgi:hypothetical protein
LLTAGLVNRRTSSPLRSSPLRSSPRRDEVERSVEDIWSLFAVRCPRSMCLLVQQKTRSKPGNMVDPILDSQPGVLDNIVNDGRSKKQMKHLTTLAGVHDQAHDPQEAGSSLGSIPSWINLCCPSCVSITSSERTRGLAQSHKPQTPRQQNDPEKLLPSNDFTCPRRPSENRMISIKPMYGNCPTRGT